MCWYFLNISKWSHGKNSDGEHTRKLLGGESTKPIDSCSFSEVQLNMNHIQAVSLQASKDLYVQGRRASGKGYELYRT